MSHWIHPDAEAELGDAAVYYGIHASRMIAEAFLAEYERVLELLAENQQLGPHAEHGMRLFHFDRFPYTIIYEENARLGPQIFAVSHQRREPDHWVSRL